MLLLWRKRAGPCDLDFVLKRVAKSGEPHVIEIWCDVRLPDQETRGRESELRRRLGSSFPIATQVEVLLAQPAVPNFPVNVGVSGGRFETASLINLIDARNRTTAADEE